MKKGILLINLGTPENPSPLSVAKYLREFLSDPRVITAPFIVRFILLYLFILPFRTLKTTNAYKKIWTKSGSPLLVNSLNLENKLKSKLGSKFKIELCFRYGSRSIIKSLTRLKNCEQIIVIPLYPQYSESTTGSVIAKVKELVKQKKIQSKLNIVPDFFDNMGFIKAQAETMRHLLKEHDYVLFSYHGLPISHILIGDCKIKCRKTCDSTSQNYSHCYRAQCFTTTKLLQEELGLDNNNSSLSFQSRLGKAKWIEPYTEDVLKKLRAKGVKNLLVSCPSFVADCLETLEEIGIRLKETWLNLGGSNLTVAACVNDSPLFVETIIDLSNNK